MAKQLPKWSNQKDCAGHDTLTGGEGNDQFVYNASTEGGDVITNFETGIDKMVFEADNFRGGSFTFTTNVSTTATFYYDAATKELFYNHTASDPGTLIATLQGGSVAAGDIVVS